MNKPLFSALYLLSLLTAGLTIHQAFAQRSPAVEPVTEVSIEDNNPIAKKGTPENGFDFTNKTDLAHVSASTKRIPANIAKSPTKESPYSFIGPLMFLMALPIALWIMIFRKVPNTENGEKIGYYPKTFQFQPTKQEYQEQDVEEEDQNFPKAS